METDDTTAGDRRPQQRRPKYRRVERGRRLPFRMTGRDREILSLVHRYRYVTIDHIHAVLGGSKQQLSRRVRHLFDHHYLTRMIRLQRIRFDLDLGYFGSEKTIHALDTKGWAELALERGSEEEQGPTWSKDSTRRGEWFIEHQLDIATFRCCLEVALRERSSLELVEWRQDQGLQDSFQYMPTDGLQALRAGIAPDAYFAVREGGVRRNFFLEVDRGTEEHPKLRRKFQTYYNYLRTSNYAKRYEGKNPEDVRVLFVTPPSVKATRSAKRDETAARTRFERLLGTLTSIRGKRSGLAQFWFTTTQEYDIGRPEALLGPVWRVVRMREGARHDETRSLFDEKKNPQPETG